MAAELYYLSNGVPVTIDVVPYNETATVGVFFKTGARYETPENNGTAHFLEHMFFRGTESRTSQQLSDEIEDMGAYANALTGHENTSYYIKGLGSDMAHMIALLADMVLHSTHAPEAVRIESGAIVQELKQNRDIYDDLVCVLAQAEAYPDQPYGTEILGPEENIKNMTRDKLVAFMNEQYHAGNLVISVAGKVDPQAVLRDLEAAFGALPRKPENTFVPAVYKGGHHVHHAVPTEQFHLDMLFNSCARGDGPDYWSTHLLGVIMGGGTSSRLYQEIREKRGLAYNVYALNRSAADTGTFEIYAATDPAEVDKLMPVVCEELRKVRDHGVTETELIRARNQMLVGLAEAAESSESRMQIMGQQLLAYGRLKTAEEIMQAVRGVTVESINAVARRIFAGAPALATVGPEAGVTYDGVMKMLAPQ